jgi:hypothetical protein
LRCGGFCRTEAALSLQLRGISLHFAYEQGEKGSPQTVGTATLFPFAAEQGLAYKVAPITAEFRRALPLRSAVTDGRDASMANSLVDCSENLSDGL